MTKVRHELAISLGIVALGIVAPWIAPSHTASMGMLWLMVLFALTWDINGGQMGYNSFGNVFFFGLGVYACVLLQRNAGFAWLPGLLLGTGAGGLVALAAAAVLGPIVLGMRGHYFAIASLGIAVAAGDIFSGWEYVGAASGLTPPLFPGSLDARNRFFYYCLFTLAVLTFIVVRYLYARRFGLVINAIRDNEDKAEAMGLSTTRYKTVAWCIAAFFLGSSGGPAANLVGFVDPTDLAFAAATYGVWMILMPILGGRGSLWGPVIGAVIFHVTQQFLWMYMLGWQNVIMGILIILIVIFFPRGIVGWWRDRGTGPAAREAVHD